MNARNRPKAAQCATRRFSRRCNEPVNPIVRNQNTSCSAERPTALLSSSSIQTDRPGQVENTVVALDTVPPRAAVARLGEQPWRIAAFALLPVRFIQVSLKKMEDFDAYPSSYPARQRRRFSHRRSNCCSISGPGVRGRQPRDWSAGSGLCRSPASLCCACASLCCACTSLCCACASLCGASGRRPGRSSLRLCRLRIRRLARWPWPLAPLKLTAAQSSGIGMAALGDPTRPSSWLATIPAWP
jgi:hypothetical protein